MPGWREVTNWCLVKKVTNLVKKFTELVRITSPRFLSGACAANQNAMSQRFLTARGTGSRLLPPGDLCDVAAEHLREGVQLPLVVQDGENHGIKIFREALLEKHIIKVSGHRGRVMSERPAAPGPPDCGSRIWRRPAEICGGGLSSPDPVHPEGPAEPGRVCWARGSCHINQIHAAPSLPVPLNAA